MVLRPSEATTRSGIHRDDLALWIWSVYNFYSSWFILLIQSVSESPSLPKRRYSTLMRALGTVRRCSHPSGLCGILRLSSRCVRWCLQTWQLLGPMIWTSFKRLLFQTTTCYTHVGTDCITDAAPIRPRWESSVEKATLHAKEVSHTIDAILPLIILHSHCYHCAR